MRREKKQEGEKSNRFPFHIVVLTDGHYIYWTFICIHNYGDIQQLKEKKSNIYLYNGNNC